MKISMNFSMDQDDLGRYANAADLRHFYESFSLSGLEVMPLGDDPQHLVEKDMVVGVHLCCITDWMDLDQAMLLSHYRKDLDYARRMRAEYVVSLSFLPSLPLSLFFGTEKAANLLTNCFSDFS